MVSLSYPEKKATITSFASIVVFLMIVLWDVDYSFQHYLSIHIVLEFFSIAVSMAIAFQAWLSFPYTKSKRILFVGAIFLCVGLLDLMHTLAFKGMPHFITASSVHNATWFWISARLTEAFFILLTLKTFNENQRIGRKLIYGISFACFVSLSYVIFNFNSFLPILVVEGEGVTPLKILLEYIITFLLLATVIIVIYQYLQKKNNSLLIFINALIFILLGELVFTLYKNVYDMYNLLGHTYKALGYFYLLRSIYISTAEEPFFREIQTKHKLLNKEKEMIAIVESSADAIISNSLGGTITSWNFGAENIYGYKAGEAIGKSISIIIPENSPLEQEISEKIDAGERIVNFETIQKRKDGKIIAVSLTVSPIIDGYGNVIGASSIARDITDRKKMEEKLLESEKRFRNIFENSLDGILLTKADGTIISANPSFCQMLGMTEQEIIQAGRNGIIDLSDARLDKYFSARRELGRYQGELNLLHKNGSKIPVELTSNVFITNDGEQFTSKVVRDISERIKTEKEMVRLDRLNMIGQMAAGIGHEIRNPLTAVRAYLEMFKNEADLSSDSDLRLMIGELDRVNGIITEFLSLSRIKPTNLKLDNINDIVNKLLPLLKAQTFKDNINFEVDLQTVSYLFVDENEIRQIILNLLKNAFEATESLGTVSLKTYETDKMVVLSVSDEGKGIPEEIQEKIGTPFFTTKEEGTGLGLAMCYSLAERNGATIIFETGKSGTVFYLQFPLIDDI